MRRICVFCGAADGGEQIFKDTAIELGKKIASLGMELVFGGGHVGLMELVADSALKAGGKVIGVIPEALVSKELAHKGLAELKIVQSMHERKAVMAELSDAFITIPGGYGTLEEFCEMLTGSMLGFHKKPCGLLNVHSYYDRLIEFFDTAAEYQFVSPAHRSLILVSTSVDDMLEQIKTFRHNVPARWAVTSEESKID